MPTYANADEAELYYAEETDWAEDPSAQSNTLEELRFTQESLKQDTSTEESEEIRGDRQQADQVRTFLEAGGGIQFELSFASFDTLIEHALMDSFSTALGISGTISSDDANNQFTSDTSASGPDLADVAEGQWISVDGFTDDSLNDYWYVESTDTSGTTHKLTVRSSISVSETGDGDETIDGSYIRNGTTKKSLFIEENFTDVGEYNYYTGMRVNEFSISFDNQSKVTGSFDFMGKEEVTDNQTSQGSGTNAANTNDVFNTSNHIPRFVEGGSVLEPVQNFDLTLTNNVRNRAILGSETSVESGVGSIDLSGSMEAYFTDQNLYKKYIDFDETSFSILSEDPAGNAYIITIFKANLTDGSENADGTDSDVTQPFDWNSKVDDATGKMIQIDKISA